MRTFLQILLFISALFFVFFIHISIIYILPYPANHLNFLFIVLLWLIIYRNSSLILWVALPISFLTELFTSLPFGVATAAILLSLFLEHWLLLNIFTNHSWHIVLLSGLLAIFCYRVTLFILVLIIGIFGLVDYTSQWSALSEALIEGAVNAAALTLLYLVGRIFSKGLNPRYV